MKETCLKNVSRKHKSQHKSLALGIVIVFLDAEHTAQQALQSSSKIPQVIGVQQRIQG